MAEPVGGKIRVTFKRSRIGGTERQRATLRGLGLRRLGDSRVLAKTPAVLGMIAKVQHLLETADEG